MSKSSKLPRISVSGRWCTAGVLLLASLVPAAGDQPGLEHGATANWKLANRFTTESLRPFLYSTSLRPEWINKSDTFWYEWRDSNGIDFWKVDAKAHKKSPLFDTAHMAALLTELTHKPYDANTLPFTTVTFDEKNSNLMRFVVTGIQYEYDFKKDTLKNIGRAPAGAGGAGFGAGRGRGRGGGGGFGQGRFGGANRDFRDWSPDKKEFVYAMDHNLYIVFVTGGTPAKDGKAEVPGKEGAPIQLTKDGEKYYSFGSREDQLEQQRQMQEMRQFQQVQRTDQNQQDGQGERGAGRRGGRQGAGQENEKRVRVNAVWSKDSKRFFITRTDERKVGDLYLVNSLAQPRPTLFTYKYDMPGEANVPQHELYSYDVPKREFKKLKVEKYKDQELFNVHWQDTTSDTLRFIRRDRLQRHLELCEMNLDTQAVKVLLTETSVDAPIENQDVRYIKPGGDFLWFSERDGWGHYYLYTNDGKLEHEVAPGPFRASEIVDVDADKGILWFVGQGREAGEDPYYKHLYRCHLDGKDIELLDSGDADHTSTLSPDKDFAVDVSSRTDMVPTAVLRDARGKVLLNLETTDISKLLEMGWKMPERFEVKAADGITDIYGNMWRPTDFNPNKKYPIIANVYPGPQTESVSTGFAAATTNQRLAELGFIVIQIGNRGGSPDRSSAYHRYGYYNLRDYGLADKKVGIEQLGARYSWIDLDRVGIFGHSGGGFMTGAAMLLPPYNDFFKVGVASSGNHDNNIYNLNWSEENHGLKETPVLDADGNDTGETTFSIKVPTNIELAPNLKGKLLLVTGDMDNNVHPANTIRLVNALIRANKRFDFMLMPGQAHGYGPLTPYFTELLMEYFAKNLLGDTQTNGPDMQLGG